MTVIKDMTNAGQTFTVNTIFFYYDIIGNMVNIIFVTYKVAAIVTFNNAIEVSVRQTDYI